MYLPVRELTMSAEKNQPNCEVFPALVLTVVEELKIPVQNQEFIMHKSDVFQAMYIFGQDRRIYGFLFSSPDNSVSQKYPEQYGLFWKLRF